MLNHPREKGENTDEGFADVAYSEAPLECFVLY